MAKRHLTKAEVLFKAKTESEAFCATSRAVKLIALIVLHEKFQFDTVDLRVFLDCFEDVLDYYNESKDYHALLEEWNEYFEQELGERILWDGV